MGIVTIVIFTALVVSIFFAAIRRLYEIITSKFGAGKSTIQSPQGYPLLGHFPYFWSAKQEVQFFKRWAEEFKKEGIFSINVLTGPKRICILKEEYIKQVLVTHCYKYGRPNEANLLFPKLSKGLFMSNGKEHAWQRKLLNPAFSYSSVTEYIKTFDKHVNNLIKMWTSKTSKSLSAVAEVDILNDLSKLTLDVIGETAFGYNFDTLISGENEISTAVERILQGANIYKRLLRRFIPFYEHLPLKDNIETKKSLQLTDAAVDKIIKERREILRQQKDSNVDIGKDFLAKMMCMQDEETGQKMTDEVIKSQVYTFMIAGHETTSVGLTWTLYLLAKHQDIQAKARDEAKTVLGNSSTITSKHLEDLTYITAVINESLRMYPPASLFLREVVQEDKLGEHVIPKGSYILIPIYAVHHLEENWPQHDKFIPERFIKTDDRKPEISNYKFMPFSCGPRICIGLKFSMAEMKVTIAKLLYTFKFELAANHPEPETKLRVTLKPSPRPQLRISLLDE